MTEIQEQDKDEVQRGRVPVGPILVGLLLLSPVLYLLLFGPACWLAANYPATSPAIEAVYYPLGRLYEATGDNAFWDRVIAYAEWWD
ncbi:MAG: hypothetical protein O2820_15690 [Planctomycetota bacterium]|nr:hypothetical protein [Planctomycetota bacterium]MDA1250659.1 hypothetical protein [Planctomycetota bacterium]